MVVSVIQYDPIEILGLQLDSFWSSKTADPLLKKTRLPLLQGV